MKKNIAIFIVFTAIGFFGFKYLYGGGRDFDSEESLKVNSVETILSAFLTNQEKANAVYLNKLIEVSGKVTQVDIQEKSVMIDNKLYATLKAEDIKAIKVNDVLRLKGRFLGYDELLEEIKVDNCSVIK
jgi:tRNA_anti-like